MLKVVIHGFNVKDPENSVGRMATKLKESYLWAYGWKGLLGVLFTNKKNAEKLAKDFLGKTINIVAHSNGAAIAVESAKQGLQIETLVLLMPALKTKTVFPDNIKKVYVIYTKHDVPTRAARIADKIPLLQLLIPNSWGAMGAKGYEGDDEKVINIAAHDCQGHSKIFKEPQLSYYSEKVASLTKTVI